MPTAQDYIIEQARNRNLARHYAMMRWGHLSEESELEIVEAQTPRRWELVEQGFTTYVIEQGFAVLIRPRTRRRL